MFVDFKFNSRVIVIIVIEKLVCIRAYENNEHI